ncbi:Adenylate isopentenyltransferase 1, chloroplastic, partial [Ananas comosus]
MRPIGVPLRRPGRESVVVIMGATGAGKTRLSVDAAVRLPGEVVNSDKLQLYRGLDLTTNKLPPPLRRGVPHHLLGFSSADLPPAAYRPLAAAAVASAASRRRVPVVAGGSASLIHALLAARFDPRADPFSAAGAAARSRVRIRYRCCFIWVDVERELLEEHLDRRVDEMVGAGMVAELEEQFRNAQKSGEEHRFEKFLGPLGKAIGVKEFGKYFAKECAYADAVEAVKAANRRLAAAQAEKIRRIATEWGWPLRRVDATPAVRARLDGNADAAAWETHVLRPAMEAVEEFLIRGEEEEEDERVE